MQQIAFSLAGSAHLAPIRPYLSQNLNYCEADQNLTEYIDAILNS
jgi:hypothetical protein